MSLIKKSIAVTVGIVIITIVLAIGPSLATTMNTAMPVAAGSPYYNASLVAPATMNSSFGMIQMVVAVAVFVLILGALMSLSGGASSGGDY